MSARSRNGPDERGGVRSVQRALEILSLITEQRPVITVREIVEEVGLPKTTVLRLMQTLEQNSLVWATASGYMAGPGLWRWAHLAKTTWEVPQETRAILRALVQRQRETANIYVRRNLHRVCVAQEESPLPLRHVVHVGDVLPLWAGATSKILLRDVPEHLIGKVAQASPDGRERLASLRVEVADAVERGYAVSHGEREVGLSAVAVPITHPRGAVVAALSLSGPTARFPPERIEELLAELRSAARQLSERGFEHPLIRSG